MKKTIKSLLLFAVAAMAITSCSKPELDAPVEPQKGAYTYVFNLASDDTKALIGDDSIEYESADGLGVFVGDIVNSPSGVDVSASPVTVTVTASKPITAGSKLYAYYPYSADNATAAASAVSLSIPAEQTQSGANYDADAMPMVSLPFNVTKDLAVQKTNPNRDAVGQLYMNNLGAIVEFNIFGADFTSEKIRSVRFVSESKIAGDFTFDLTKVAAEEDLVISDLGLSAAKTSLSGAVSVGAAKTSAAKVYMVVAPGEHKGVVQVTTDGAMYVYNMDAAVAFNRSNVRPLNLDLAKAQRNVFSVMELMSNAGYNPDAYVQLEMNYINYAYYQSADSRYISSLCTSASNCNKYVATQIFTKAQIPNGSVIVCGEGCQYRPEGWVNLDELNNKEGGDDPSRPANVSANVVEVDDDWWGEHFNYRGFNLSSGANLTDETALQLQQNFAVFVPRVDSATASFEDILSAAGYNLSNYERLNIVYSYYKYWDSSAGSGLKTPANTVSSNTKKHIATPQYYKGDLPNGTLIIRRPDIKYRPDAWTSLDEKTSSGRPGNETSKGIVEVNDDWWGDWTVRGFNVSYADGRVISETYDESAPLCQQLAESFAIYVPKKVSSADLTALIKSAGYNPDDYVQMKIDYTDFAYYQSNNDYKSMLRTVEFDGWGSPHHDYVATPIYTRSDLPNGTLIVQVDNHRHRPEGWTDLNLQNGTGAGQSGVGRPADVTVNVVEVDDVWWGSFNYRGFNLCIYENGKRQKLAESQDATTNRCQEVHDGFGIFVPKKAVAQKEDDGAEEDGNSIKILAIGNSFSQDATEYLYGILKDLGYNKIVIGNIYKGGCTLETHANYFTNNTAGYTYYLNTTGSWTSTSSSAPIAPLQSQDWDFITMQQGSPKSGLADTYEPYLTTLIDIVKQHCPDAQLVWHMTWAYQANSTKTEFVNYDNNQMTMYNAIVNATQTKILTNSNFVKVIPNGTAVQNMRTSYVGDNLTRDGYHMSLDKGRYLTALTYAKVLTGGDLANVSYTPSSQTYSSQDIAAMKDAVNKAVATPYAVTQSAYPPDENAFDYTTATLEEILANDGYDPASYNKLELSFTNYAYWNSTSEKLGGVYSEKYSAANESIHGYTNYKEFICTQIIPKSSIPAGSVIVVKGGCMYRPDGWVSLDAKASSRPAEVTSNYTVLVNDAWWGTLNYRGFNVAFNPREVLTDTTCGQLQQSFAIYVPKN